MEDDVLISKKMKDYGMLPVCKRTRRGCNEMFKELHEEIKWKKMKRRKQQASYTDFVSSTCFDEGSSERGYVAAGEETVCEARAASVDDSGDDRVCGDETGKHEEGRVHEVESGKGEDGGCGKGNAAAREENVCGVPVVLVDYDVENDSVCEETGKGEDRGCPMVNMAARGENVRSVHVVLVDDDEDDRAGGEETRKGEDRGCRNVNLAAREENVCGVTIVLEDDDDEDGRLFEETGKGEDGGCEDVNVAAREENVCEVRVVLVDDAEDDTVCEEETGKGEDGIQVTEIVDNEDDDDDDEVAWVEGKKEICPEIEETDHNSDYDGKDEFLDDGEYIDALEASLSSSSENVENDGEEEKDVIQSSSGCS